MHLLRARDVAALDAAAERAGLPPDVLMTRAGRAVAGFAVRCWPAARRVVVLAGPGNNGGDGYVAAAELARRGRSVTLVELVDAPKTAPAAAARAALDDLPAAARARVDLRLGPPPAALLADADLVIDALLGAGLGRPVAGPLLAWLEVVRRARRPVLAVDVPTGVSADRAVALGPTLDATWTLQLSGVKPASWLAPARDHYGRWALDDLGLPDDLVARHACGLVWDDAAAGAALPRRASDVHKYRAGAVLVVAGSERYPGAAELAARGALRAGAGYVTCATRGRAPGPAEIVAIDWSPTPAGALALADHEAARRARALVVGPGLDVDVATLAALLGAVQVPVVLDGGALQPDLEAAVRAHGDVVLTPHAGEAARWLDRSAGDVAADPLGAAADLAARSGAIVVLKGPGTVVATPNGRLGLVPAGPPALATAGAGDVLAGAIGAVLAAAAAGAAADGADASAPGDPRPRLDRVAAAVALHAAAARLALAPHARAGRPPSAGISAGDVAEALPAARAVLEHAAGRST